MPEPDTAENRPASTFTDLMNKARKFEELGFYDEAIRKYNEAINLDSANPENTTAAARIVIIEWIVQGMQCEELASEAQAADFFKKAVNKEPGNYVALSYLGFSQIGHDDEQAKINIRAAVDLNNKDPRALAAQSLAFTTEGDFSNAFDLIENAIQLYEGYSDFVKALVLQSKGYILNSIGSYPEATSVLEQSLKLNENDVYTLIYLGESTVNSGEYEDAIKWLTEAIKSPLSDSLGTSCYYYLGIAFYSVGKYQDAMDAFNTALKTEPKNPNTLCGIAFALHNLGRHTESERLFEQVLKIDKFNSTALFGRRSAGILAEKEKEIGALIQTVQIELLRSSQDTITRSNHYLDLLLTDFRTGLDWVKNMFLIQFALGVGLIISAVIAGVAGVNNIVTAILGITGGASVIITLIREPPLQLQKNRVDFSQWMMGYFNWYNAFLETNIFLGQKASRKEALKWDEIKAIQDHLTTNTHSTINLMEICCEFKERQVPVPESEVKDEKAKTTKTEMKTDAN
jgi:tetratricopeptide (TPR) repeat protein